MRWFGAGSPTPAARGAVRGRAWLSGGGSHAGIRIVPLRRGARHGGDAPSRGSSSASCRSSSSSCSGWSTSCPKRSPRSGIIRRRTRSTRCACCRWRSAACCGRSRGCGRTPSRSATGSPTAPRSTTTTTSRWAKRRRPARCCRMSIVHLRHELDAMAAKGTLPASAQGAAQRARLRRRHRAARSAAKAGAA